MSVPIGLFRHFQGFEEVYSAKVSVKMSYIGSKSGLAVALSRLKVFERPKVMAEQYPTDSEIAAEVLLTAHMRGDLSSHEGKVSVDLGCGTGILGIGCLLLGAKECFFVDSDPEAVEIAKSNYSNMESEHSIEGGAHFVCRDIALFSGKADIVVQNPPFGVKVRHADRPFLNKAMEIAPIVYSFHKSGSRKFVDGVSREKGFRITDVWDFDFPLKAAFGFHSRRIKMIPVSCFRLEKVV